jgi:hypothetical protein
MGDRQRRRQRQRPLPGPVDDAEALRLICPQIAARTVRPVDRGLRERPGIRRPCRCHWRDAAVDVRHLPRVPKNHGRWPLIADQGSHVSEAGSTRRRWRERKRGQRRISYTTCRAFRPTFPRPAFPRRFPRSGHSGLEPHEWLGWKRERRDSTHARASRTTSTASHPISWRGGARPRSPGMRSKRG